MGEIVHVQNDWRSLTSQLNKKVCVLTIVEGGQRSGPYEVGGTINRN